jgi:hypothetical protein
VRERGGTKRRGSERRTENFQFKYQPCHTEQVSHGGYINPETKSHEVFVAQQQRSENQTKWASSYRHSKDSYCCIIKSY